MREIHLMDVAVFYLVHQNDSYPLPLQPEHCIYKDRRNRSTRQSVTDVNIIGKMFAMGKEQISSKTTMYWDIKSVWSLFTITWMVIYDFLLGEIGTWHLLPLSQTASEKPTEHPARKGTNYHSLILELK